MRESKIEKPVCEYAEDMGCLALKLHIIGKVGFPDRLFIYYGERFRLAEFKATGKGPRPSQVTVIKLLAKFGIKVHVIDSIEYGKEMINDFIN